ncbi:MAG: aldehyde dehydrogenase family protein [Bacteroidales bacterium]
MVNTKQIHSLFPSELDIPRDLRHEYIIDQTEFLINGKIEEWDGPVKILYSPIYIDKSGKYERKIIGKHPLLDKDTALNVLKAAETSYNYGKGKWPLMQIEERIECMSSFMEKLISFHDSIVKFMMWEIGKPSHEATKEFDRTIDYLSDTLEAAKDIAENNLEIHDHEGIKANIKAAPVGVVLCMGPFNYPLNESFATIIPALMMGNSVIFKPPKYGSLLYQPLLELFSECFPSGVFNTVYGHDEDVIIPLLNTGRIDMLAFIGTSKAANILHSHHPKPNRLKEVLGLEAKNPAIIFEDADIGNSVRQCLKGALTFNGQRCTALKILFVHSSIVDKFLGRLKFEIEKIKIGMPWDEDVTITPIPDAERIKYLSELVHDARNKGALVLNDNGGYHDKSLFFPTLLYPVDSSMSIYHEEQFGPVIPVVTFDDIQEPIRYVWQSKYGQQISLFGNDRATMNYVVSSVLHQTGRVNLNTICQRGPDQFPFTGRKDSAKSILSVKDALAEFSMPGIVAVKDDYEGIEMLSAVLKGK